ncbi:tyrosine-type recombinase/integrase [Dehalogenimonas etheniformans]|uniref:Integrase n=1 Tax=Dehalogenimonas etheniformans TaxID=1536648 RepID=A0A2P5PA36_9CHLR|nr:tyrosine-type recombinase/integrase [Dehalogenimonas etheniformans]PPD59135.1 integrase [Dehalogenimonas etheniformans]QNT75821.1 tyrosine-type recombinase/integrase [Dehalogenimonas etheniformans]
MKAYLEPTDIFKMKEEATNVRDELLVSTSFRLGTRISETLAIGVDDIDFANGTITIKHLKSRIKLKCPECQAALCLTTIFCPACGAKVESAIHDIKDVRRQRVLPVDDTLLSLVKKFIASGGPVERNGRLVLFGINRHRAWQIIKNLAEKAGLPKLINPETGKIHNASPHKLRDAFAVFAMKHNDSGEGMRMLQQHLGHQSFNTTAKYRKIAGEEHRKWYQDLWTGGSED